MRQLMAASSTLGSSGCGGPSHGSGGRSLNYKAGEIPATATSMATLPWPQEQGLLHRRHGKQNEKSKFVLGAKRMQISAWFFFLFFLPPFLPFSSLYFFLPSFFCLSVLPSLSNRHALTTLVHFFLAFI